MVNIVRDARLVQVYDCLELISLVSVSVYDC